MQEEMPALTRVLCDGSVRKNRRGCSSSRIADRRPELVIHVLSGGSAPRETYFPDRRTSVEQRGGLGDQLHRACQSSSIVLRTSHVAPASAYANRPAYSLTAKSARRCMPGCFSARISAPLVERRSPLTSMGGRGTRSRPVLLPRRDFFVAEASPSPADL